MAADGGILQLHTMESQDLGKTLKETTTSIKRLIDTVEQREKTGQCITAMEIEAIAYQLDTYVEDLVKAADNSSREQRLG